MKISTIPNTISPSRLEEIRARLAAMKSIPSIPSHPLTVKAIDETLDETPVDIIAPVTPVVADDSIGHDRHGNLITYNENQIKAIQLGGSGESLVLIGAAGTGKTTCMHGMIEKLSNSGKAGLLRAEGHKYLTSDTPGIVVVAFTRRAVANIRRNMPLNMQGNCITIHKLLEYEPVYYDIQDPVTFETKTTMRFQATRNALRLLPQSIHTIVVEEGSMCSVELSKELCDALGHEVQWIFLGDIQQLPPVFGSAILGYKLLELPVVELTEVYRQALESPIIRLAHRILSGKGIPASEFSEWKIPSQLTIHPWKKKINADHALQTVAKFFTTAIANNAYDVEEDIILIPYNKSFGTDELNKHIANYLAIKEDKPVYEIISGFTKIYISIGDKVLVDKEDGVVIDIKKNLNYAGRNPQPESKSMDYWGYQREDSKAPEHEISSEDNENEIDLLLSKLASIEDEDRVNAASHVITVQMLDTGKEIKLDKAGDINNLILGYALTVHKSQGSEWRKVFLVFHQSHATMMQRELLYTAVTRAREELYIICEPETFVNGIKSQRIKGNTLAEKAEYFKGALDKKREQNPAFLKGLTPVK